MLFITTGRVCILTGVLKAIDQNRMDTFEREHANAGLDCSFTLAGLEFFFFLQNTA